MFVHGCYACNANNTQYRCVVTIATKCSMWLQNLEFFEIFILLFVMILVSIFQKFFKLTACVDEDFYKLL